MSEKIFTTKATIWLAEKDIIRTSVPNGVVLEEKDIQDIFDAYSKLGFGPNNKGGLLVEAEGAYTLSKEGRDLGEKGAKEFFVAVVVISQSVAMRLLINLLNNLYNFGIPLNLYPTEKAAVNWINRKIARARGEKQSG